MIKSVPVLMYHYISHWKNANALSPDRFEDHCQTLTRKGWRGIGLDEAEQFFLKGKPLPDKCALFTFDDGYLDNYVYAAPILQQYGHQGVVFAVTGKLEPAETPRPTLADVRGGSSSQTDLPRVDAPMVPHRLGFEEREDTFMNWEEARTLERTGTMRVSCHSAWHKAVFTGPEFSGFYQPEARTRTFDRVDADVVWGLPRFATGSRLAHRAFLPSPRLIQAIRNLVPQEKDEAFAFFADPEKTEHLKALVAEFPQNELGAYEDSMSMQAALRRELSLAKETLEREMGREERSLCWPWGAYCADALCIAKELGFRVFFTTAMGANPPGEADHVHRFKAKDKPGPWLASRLNIYSRPWISKLYTLVRM